jgi:hypothetical protein
VALVRTALVLAIATSAVVARAQPGAATSDILRAGNSAALAGDWPLVLRLVEPLFPRPLAPADLGEAHRLAGIATAAQQRAGAAERHFLTYLRIEPDARLDAALYPPEVVMFFNDVASRHAAELRALRTPRPERSWVRTLLPPLGQLQNGDRTRAYVIGGLLGSFLIVNLATYTYLRSWCTHTQGSGGGGLNCTVDGDHRREAAALKPYNVASGIGVIVIYAYGVYDGVKGYRRRSRQQAIQPLVRIDSASSLFGVSGEF